MVAESMVPIPFPALLEIVFSEYRQHQSIFGIPEHAFCQPVSARPEETSHTYGLFSELVSAPLGPAIGPHTHLTQSIVCAYLCGGRVIELKTVQKLDQLELQKPCVDAADIGYNTEWSTELTSAQATAEYFKAWLLLHLLRGLLWNEWGQEPDFLFLMSVGYDLEGIQGATVDAFLEDMRDAGRSAVFAELVDELVTFLEAQPELGFFPGGSLNNSLSDSPENSPAAPSGPDPRLDWREFVQGIRHDICRSVALSTMHGCPPDEIEAICTYLLTEKRFDTLVKLNPTLLGQQDVDQILSDAGYSIDLDSHSFEVDLRYSDAVQLLGRLQSTAAAVGRGFGLKLSNTLPVHNTDYRLPGETMYLSGRALYLLTTELAARLCQDLHTSYGVVPLVSYSGGAHAANIVELLETGIGPVTISTDLLKPGGYLRLAEALRAVEDRHFPDRPDPEALRSLADSAKQQPAYRARGGEPTARVHRPLPLFDCFVAPCREACPIGQDVPGYIRLLGEGRPAEALSLILATNAFPGLTGAICDQRCARACTRIEYDRAVQIRAEKELVVRAARHTGLGMIPSRRPAMGSAENGAPVAVLTAGLAGVSAAYYLVRAGIPAVIFESSSRIGERIEGQLAKYRLTGNELTEDLTRVAASGVKFRLARERYPDAADLVEEGFAEVVLSGPDPELLRSFDLRLHPDGTPKVESETRRTPNGIYLGGDGESDPPRIIEVIASGKRIAAAILAARRAGSTVAPEADAGHSSGGRFTGGRFTGGRHTAQQGPKPDPLQVLQKHGRFAAPGRGSDGDVARAEFQRCLECNVICLKCVQVCPNRANIAIRMQASDGFTDAFQIVHMDSWCNDCGNCAVFCPYDGKPYREKFTLFADRTAFEASNTPGICIDHGQVLLRGGEAQANTDGGGVTNREAKRVATLVERIQNDYSYLLRAFGGGMDE
ncbi:MAG: hypothetical protein EA428_06295 [Spirochaetaceae bacterium]|nr:MAG: hypothetical protein EA428_06295 [Spirochaetaceae bacterium]